MRIRCVKPEFFKHEEIHDAEVETGLPLRLAYIGLWCACDREGRFKWRPRSLGVDIIPYDDVDFSRVLDALATRGFVVKYASEDGEFGFVPSFCHHQVINNRERDSVLPDPSDCTIVTTREPRVDDACCTPLVQDQGEGKGREGKGTLETRVDDAKGKRAKRKRHSYPDDFEEAWEEYGRKGTKKDAAKEWDKLDDEEKDMARKAIPVYISQVSEKKFQKDFERFLSKEIWEQHQPGSTSFMDSFVPEGDASKALWARLKAGETLQ